VRSFLCVREQYRIGRVIGRGGMATVYEAIGPNGKVAIKRLRDDLVSDAEMWSRFEREALAIRTIDHPNVVALHDFHRTPDGGVCMVLEHVEGVQLSRLIDHGALSIERAIHIVIQICDALEAAHARGIIHRDLKPDNVIVGAGDRVKVLDFGIAKFTERLVPSITLDGHTIGTPHYMSPEQMSARRDLDHRADLYSLGVILFTALTGARPIDAPSLPALIDRVLHAKPARIRSLNPAVPRVIDRLVDRLLSKKPEDRPSSATEVRAILARALRPSIIKRVLMLGVAATIAACIGAAFVPDVQRMQPTRRVATTIWSNASEPIASPLM
jgi:serine/threonine protein kinase